jgi:hypothetical protein
VLESRHVGLQARNTRCMYAAQRVAAAVQQQPQCSSMVALVKWQHQARAPLLLLLLLLLLLVCCSSACGLVISASIVLVRGAACIPGSGPARRRTA